MFVIGIDPHKRSHTAAVLDDTEALVGQVRVNADRWQRDRLLRFAVPFEPRTWAVEAAGGLGALLAQQLVAAGERVVDVPPTLSARVRLLDSGRTDKSDPHDARSAAIVALRHARLRPLPAVDHSAVLRVLANRHHDLTGARTRAICRLHALLFLLIAGGSSGRLSAQRAGQLLRALRPLQRHRTPRSIVGTTRPSPVEPPREPSAEPRVARRRDHTGIARHHRTCLLRPQDRGGQDPQGSATRVETTHQRRGLPPTRRRHPTLTSRGPGGQTGTTPRPA
jgi:Transposase